MNTKKDCCAQCYGRMGTLAGGGTYCQVNREGCCHTDSTKKEKLEFRPSSIPASVIVEKSKEIAREWEIEEVSQEKDWNNPRELKHKLKEALELADEILSQGKESSEKDASYYYQEGYTDGYSAGIEDGKEESSNLVQPESKEIPHSSSSFTEKTIENFREEFPGALWMSMKGFGDVNLRPRLEQWLSSKLEEARNDLIECPHVKNQGICQDCIEAIRKEEHTRILNLIESKKKEIPGESIDYLKSLRERDVHECGENDGRLAALDSLIEEITKNT